MNAALHAFPDDMATAAVLAGALDLPCRPIHRRHFPDGESLVRVESPSDRPILFRRLDLPNGKLFELMLAADALTPPGAEKPILVAPYLPYMRQDAAFRPGEAVSQRVLGRVLDDCFSAIVTVEPHLHRTASLASLFPGTETRAISAAPVLAPLVPPRSLVVGPDGESAPLARGIAEAAGRDWLTLSKVRHGDRAVEFDPEREVAVAGRAVVLVDDICSSGTTLADAAQLLLAAGARSVEALVVHALHDEAAGLRLRHAGIVQVRSTDSLNHPSNAASLVPLLADCLIEVLR